VSKRRFRRLLPLVLAVGLLASGCFQIRFMRMTPDSIAMGERAIVRLEMYPAGTVTGFINADGYPFVLVGFDDSALNNPTVSQFDLFQNFGGRFDRELDNDLRNLLLAGGNCEANGIDAADVTGMKWWAWRTSTTVDSTSGGLGDIFRVKVALDRDGGDNGEAAAFVIFTGTWGDIIQDGGPPIAGETACTSMLFSGVALTP